MAKPRVGVAGILAGLASMEAREGMMESTIRWMSRVFVVAALAGAAGGAVAEDLARRPGAEELRKKATTELPARKAGQQVEKPLERIGTPPAEAPKLSPKLSPGRGLQTLEPRAGTPGPVPNRPSLAAPGGGPPGPVPNRPSLAAPGGGPPGPGLNNTITTDADTAGRGCAGQCYCETTSQAMNCMCSAKGIEGPCFVWGCKKTGAGWHCDGASSSN